MPTWPPALSPFLACAAVAVVTGGLVGAVTRPFGWDHGPWAAAFLVLVAGVAQIGLGAGQAALVAPAVPRPVLAGEVALWNLGSLLVLVGTTLSAPVGVSVGGVALVVALVLFARATRPTGRSSWVRWTYVALVTALAVSVPIGLLLSWARH